MKNNEELHEEQTELESQVAHGKQEGQTYVW